ncbi:MAG: hypothetical protein U1A77_24575 [Pirellulales bacterium]
MTDDASSQTRPFTMPSIIDVALVCLLIVGAFMAWRSGVERRQLEAHLAHLQTCVEEIDLVDPTKVHIRAIDTKQPFHFAWRVYLPPAFDAKIRSRFTLSGGSSWSSSTSTNAAHFIARVRIRKNDFGEWEIYEAFHQGSSRSSLGSPKIQELFDKYGEAIPFEQLGANQTEVFAPHESRELLKILLPMAVREELKPTYPKHQEARFPEIMSISVGKTEDDP